MLIQCAMNGHRGGTDHPALPVTPAELAADAAACWAAGARSVHLHPRRPEDGREGLAAATHDAAVAAVRAAVPELEISCSTQRDIDLGGAATRVEAIAAWTQPPDLVSLNLVQDDAEAAVALAHAIDARVAPLGRPRLWHGNGPETWAVVDAGRALGRDVRVGLEDTLVDRDGRPTTGNAAQVRAVAVA